MGRFELINTDRYAFANRSSSSLYRQSYADRWKTQIKRTDKHLLVISLDKIRKRHKIIDVLANAQTSKYKRQKCTPLFAHCLRVLTILYSLLSTVNRNILLRQPFEHEKSATDYQNLTFFLVQKRLSVL